MDKLLIIDGNSLINRAFYALPLLTNKNGEYSNAVYGFTNILIKAIQEHKPTHIAVAFDYGHKTFRNNIYAEYKGTRKPTPAELKSQFPILKRLLTAMNIKLFEKEGIEADDIIGTIAKKYPVKKIILSGDKDVFQLIDGSTEVWFTKKGISEIALMNEKTLYDEYKLKPGQIIELKALMGDSSDNIPGVAGVGEKTALSLLQQYNTIDGVYADINNIPGKLQEKLIAGKDDAYMSKTLATINTGVEINKSLDYFKYDYPFDSEVYKIFEEYNFNSLLKKGELFIAAEDNKPAPKFEAYKIKIKNYEALNGITEHIKAAGIFAFDLTDNAFNFAYDKTTEYIISFAGTLFDEAMDYKKILGIFEPVFCDGNIKKYCYDIKNAKHMLYKQNIVLNGAAFDCNLANYLLNAGERTLTRENLFLNYRLDESYPAINLLLLEPLLSEEIKTCGLKGLYEQIEFPLINVLFDMEVHGFKIDVDVLYDLSKRYILELNDLTKVIYTMAGEEFNINSPKQMGVLLFEKLKLNTYNNKKHSTGIDKLEELYDAHPVVPLIIRYRQIQKLSSTYLEAFKNIVDKEGFIHTLFNQTLTATGRLSSSEPNLQNIPVRTDEGKVLRNIFIPSSPDGWLVSADYSQIELRLLAHFSGDPGLIEAYKNGMDIHTQTASEVFGVPAPQVTADMRRSAKAVNFGIIYGISDYGLSQGLSITRKQAKEYIETYFKKYPGVKAYMDNNVALAKQQGYVTSLMGRRRKLIELNSPNYAIRQFGERAAMNMPLQGTASDIIKIAMVRVADAIKKNNLKSRLILQVHDELIIDTAKDELNAVIKLVKYEMENAVKLDVPLIADVSGGKNWYECK